MGGLDSGVVLTHLICGGIILSIGVAGNCLVVFYFGFIRKCQRRYELLLFLLGVFDCFASLSNFRYTWSMLLNPTLKIKLVHIGCKYTSQISWSMNEAACYMLAAMFYVRYRSIVKPLESQKITKTKIVILALIIFVCAILCRVPFIVNTDEETCFTNKNSIFDRMDHLVYELSILSLCRFLFPLFITLYCCCRLRCCLQRSAVALNNKTVNKRNKRVLRAFLWLTLVFVLSIGVTECLRFFKNVKLLTNTNKLSATDINAYYILMPLFYLNSSINVVVYAGYMPKFRKFCYKFVTCFQLHKKKQFTST